MAKRIIILEKAGGGFTSFKYVFWVDVPATRQSFYANPSKVSAYSLASSSELALLQVGSVTEVVDTITLTEGATVANVQSSLIIQWQNVQDSVNSSNPWNRYGTFWDGISWTIGGVS